MLIREPGLHDLSARAVLVPLEKGSVEQLQVRRSKTKLGGSRWQRCR